MVRGVRDDTRVTLVPIVSMSREPRNKNQRPVHEYVYTMYAHELRSEEIVCTRPSQHQDHDVAYPDASSRRALLERSGFHTRLLAPYTVNFCYIFSSFATRARVIGPTELQLRPGSLIVPGIEHPRRFGDSRSRSFRRLRGRASLNSHA